MEQVDLFDALRLDRVNVAQAQQEILSLLMKIGLSGYEAKAYLALVMRSHGSAEEIAEAAEIPRTSAYKVLNSLRVKAFATIGGGRPAVFYPVPPKDIRDRTVAELDQVFDKMEMLKGMLSERGTPQLIYTITGKEKVLSKLGEMIDASRETFFISSPVLREVTAAHSARLARALKRGVKITVVAEPSAKVPEATEVIRRQDLFATDAITDSELAMIASPDLTICGYSDNPFLVTYFEHFFNMSLGRGV